MSNGTTTSGKKIDKRHVEATVFFAINHIPQIDEATLEKFLELVNITGNFGSISDQQLIQKMCLLVKYVPGVCKNSLFMLAEILGIDVSPHIHYIHTFTEEMHR